MPEESNQSKFDNYSLDFPGAVSQRISVTASDTILPDQSDPKMSISAWIYMDTSSSGISRTIFSSGRVSSGAMDYTFEVNNGYLFFKVRTTNVSPHYTTITGGTTISLNTWYHVAATWDGANLNLYLNSVVDATPVAATSFYASSGSSPKIGVREGGGYYSPWAGKLGQICYFDYALSETQVKYLYNNNAGGSTPNPQNPMAIPGNSPVAYYDLGGSSTGDAAASSPNTLTVPNSSVPSATVFDFNGTLDFIEVPNSSSLQITDNLTLSCWINVNNVTINNNILDKFYDGTADGRSYLLRVQSSRIYLYLANASGTGAPSYISTSTLQNNTWYHITTTFSSTGEALKQVKIYINGSLDAEHGKTDLIASNDEEFRIGSSYNTSNRFGGKISNAQIWNSELTASEITTLYNNGTPYVGTQPQAANLKGWWRLNIDTSNWNGNEWLVGNSISTYNKSFNLSSNGNYINFGNTFFDNYIQTGEEYPISTISFWIRSKYTITGNMFARVLQLSSNNSWFIRLDTDTKIAFYTGSGGNYRRWNTYTSMTDNGWHHFALVLPSGTDKTLSKMYMDGQELSINVAGSPGSSGIYNMSWLRAGDSKWFDYSNIQFYNTAFSDSDISTLYNGGVPLVEASLNPSNLKGWWKMDDTATFSTNWNIPDASGNNNPGVSSGLTESSRVDGLVSVAGKSSGMTTANLVNSDLERSIPYSSYSMDFDGIDDEINFSSTNDLGLNNTVSMWVNLNSGYSGALLGESSYGSTGYFLLPYTTGFLVRIGATLASASNVHTYLTAGSWHNLTVVRNAGNFLFYVDGAFIETVALSSTTTTKFDIIGNSRTGGDPIEGKISNVCGFNSILTEDQILTIYNGGVPNDISSLSPTGWWSLSGDSYYDGINWICPDLGSGSNNGTSAAMGGSELVGNGPGSTANGVATGMNIPGNLQGNAPNSSSNAFSVNMNADDKSSSVPDIS